MQHIPAALLDLCDPATDFGSRCHRIQSMFGVREFLVVSPVSGSGDHDHDMGTEGVRGRQRLWWGVGDLGVGPVVG